MLLVFHTRSRPADGDMGGRHVHLCVMHWPVVPRRGETVLLPRVQGDHTMLTWFVHDVEYTPVMDTSTAPHFVSIARTEQVRVDIHVMQTRPEGP